MPENPYLFIAGCPRSGTTLLERMLDSHPQLAVCNEANVVPRAALKAQALPSQPLTRDLLEEIVGHKFFSHLGIDADSARALAGASETLVEFVVALLDEFARRRGKRLAGDKVPEYGRYLPALARLFPAARSILIVRDGRDVALATLDWMTPDRFLGRRAMWKEEPVAMCALYWRRQVREGERGRASIRADRCLQVRYEELVRAPEATMRSVASFLELPFDAATLEYHKGRTHDGPALQSKDRWLPPTAGLRDWRSDLSARDVQLFEALAGEQLVEFGYPLATATTGISPEVMAVAERCRRWWERKMEHRFSDADSRG